MLKKKKVANGKSLPNHQEIQESYGAFYGAEEVLQHTSARL